MSSSRKSNEAYFTASIAPSPANPLAAYKARKDRTRERVLSKYEIIGYIASGTYGRVYKARARTTSASIPLTRGSSQAGIDGKRRVLTPSLGDTPSQLTPANSSIGGPPSSSNTTTGATAGTTPTNGATSASTTSTKHPARTEGRICAIKKFKADKEGEVTHYTGISQSACREMALCRELNHENVISLIETILEDKSIYMVFDYAEHDLLQIIHYHCQPERRPIPENMIKSVLWQLLNGVSYLHQNWVLHRDLKPANIMLSSDGVVKIGDLGLARLFNNPLITLWGGDKVVVTIWYRAPELLLGARHYTPAIDLWAVGCIFAELLSLRPIFKGEEAKMDNKRNIPFQRNQIQKVIEILGLPTTQQWPSLPQYPEYKSFSTMKSYPPSLEQWYHNTGYTSRAGFDLLNSLLTFDPAKRITAEDALLHPYFLESPKVSKNVFDGVSYEYPSRRISNEEHDMKLNTFSSKRSAIGTNDTGHIRKKQK